MKQIFHKTASFLMAFVVLFSTMSFTIDMHYCGNKLVDTAIFHKVKTCGMEMEKAATDNCSIIKNNCCSDTQVVIDGQDEVKPSLESLTFEQQFITSFIYTYLNLFEGIEKDIYTYKDNNTPLGVKEIYKLDESYLI